jgi:hypothetical protein
MISEKINKPNNHITWAPKMKITYPSIHAPPLSLEINKLNNHITWAPKMKITYPSIHAPPLFLEKS